MNNKQYKLYSFENGYLFGYDTVFNTLEETRERLVEYYTVDIPEKKLEEIEDLSLLDLLNMFKWELQDLQGNEILFDMFGKEVSREMSKEEEEYLKDGYDLMTRERLALLIESTIRKSGRGEIGLADFIEGIEYVLNQAKEAMDIY